MEFCVYATSAKICVAWTSVSDFVAVLQLISWILYFWNLHALRRTFKENIDEC